MPRTIKKLVTSKYHGKKRNFLKYLVFQLQSAKKHQYLGKTFFFKSNHIIATGCISENLKMTNTLSILKGMCMGTATKKCHFTYFFQDKKKTLYFLGEKPEKKKKKNIGKLGPVGFLEPYVRGLANTKSGEIILSTLLLSNVKVFGR